MRTICPTSALVLSDVPPARKSTYRSRFTSFDGYEAAGNMEAMVEIRNRAARDGLAALTLEELRIEHFRNQRAQRHGGGPYGPDDPNDRKMDAIREEVRARLSASPASVAVWQGDITRLDVDAIVNAANAALAGGGGVDGAIHRAAGPELLAASREIPEVSPGVRCPVGEARVTRGFKLPAQMVIHTVGPVWKGGASGEAALLASAYRSSLQLAYESGAGSVAFPAISTGVYGFPSLQAARVAVRTCRAWQAVDGTPERILLVAFSEDDARTLRRALAEAADAPL